MIIKYLALYGSLAILCGGCAHDDDSDRPVQHGDDATPGDTSLSPTYATARSLVLSTYEYYQDVKNDGPNVLLVPERQFAPTLEHFYAFVAPESRKYSVDSMHESWTLKSEDAHCEKKSHSFQWFRLDGSNLSYLGTWDVAAEAGKTYYMKAVMTFGAYAGCTAFQMNFTLYPNPK